MDSDLTAKVRDEIKKAKGTASRALLLAYGFVRGVPHELPERRVSEHNLPSPWAVAVELERVRLGKPVERPWSVSASPELEAYLKVPEERIKRFGPHVPGPRAPRAQVWTSTGTSGKR